MNDVAEIMALLFFLLFLSAFLVSICMEFIKDIIFYSSNGWNYSVDRKNSFKLYDGDPGADVPVTGKRKLIAAAIFILGLVFFVLIGFLILLGQIKNIA